MHEGCNFTVAHQLLLVAGVVASLQATSAAKERYGFGLLCPLTLTSVRA
jgi:hypothetical protein